MRPAEAEPLARHAVQVLSETLGSSNAQTLSARHGLALAVREKGDLTEAESLLRQLIDDLSAAHDARDEDDRKVIRVRSRVDLGRILGTRGDPAAAESMFREALWDAEASLGPLHEDTLAVLSGLAYQLVLARKFEEARGLFEKALAGQSRLLGEAHLATARTRNGYGFCYFREGRFPEAAAVFRRQIELLEPRQGPAFELWRALANLAFVLQQQGDLEGVEAVCPRAVEVGYACLPPAFGELDALESTWILARHQRRGLEGVEELLRGLWRELSASRGVDDGHTRRILRRLVLFYRSVGNTQESQRYESL
jgi:tetratricopeptide (TPR) repeat protein